MLLYRKVCARYDPSFMMATFTIMFFEFAYDVLLGATSAVFLISMLKYVENPATKLIIEKCGEYENEKDPFEEVLRLEIWICSISRMD